MYPKTIIKNGILNRYTLILMLSGLILGLFLNYVYRKISMPKESCSIAVIDRDDTELSNQLTERLSSMEQINVRSVIRDKEISADQVLASDTYYAVYTIRQGYEENMRSGKYRGLIEVHSYGVGYADDRINDKLSAVIIEKHIYYDMFNRINKSLKMDFDIYQKMAQDRAFASQILFLDIEYPQNDLSDLRAADDNEYAYRGSLYPATAVIGWVILSLNLEAVGGICRLRESGIADRLRLAGYRLIHSYAGVYAVSSIRCVAFAAAVSVFFKGLDIFVWLSLALTAQAGFLIFALLGYVAKKEAVYNAAARLGLIFIMLCFMLAVYLS